MKKKLSIFLLCSWAIGVQAQRIVVSNVEALPGETVSLQMQIDCEGGSYTGLEFDILFPCDGFTTGSATNTTSGWDGAFTIGDVGGVGIANLARCGVLSYSATPIPGQGLHPLGTVEFTVPSALTLGEYTVKATNMTLIGEGRTPVAEVSFQLNVVSIHTVTLDENSTDLPVASNGAVNVVVQRTIRGGYWSTIVLPFAMNATQISNAFGNDVVLADFTGSDTEFDDADNVVGIQMNFQNVTAIEANHPYLIKVSQDITSFSLNGVNVTPDEDEAYFEFDNGKTGSRRVVYSGFYGTYHAGTTLDENTLFLNGNKFYYSDGTIQMKGYRAYFYVLDLLPDAENGNSVKLFIDGLETKVDGLSVKDATNTIFDLSGRKIEKPQQRGVYIVNGKKVIVK